VDLGISGSTSLYEIQKCVFSGSFPDSVAINVGENFVNTMTESYVVNHLNTFYCPTASPTESRIASSTASSQFLVSDNFIESTTLPGIREVRDFRRPRRNDQK
jgi:hypothetical protein